MQCLPKQSRISYTNNVKSIAFQNISTNVYHFPKDKAAEIAIRTVKDFFSFIDNIEKVIFVCFDEENYDIYQKILTRYLYLPA
jgi:O-acetyl-ADP-ribose deacetylase (regulator of RNase III)